MLEIRTTDEFAAWFAAQDDGSAEEVATALEIVEKFGPGRAAPGSSEFLLWYEHPDAREMLALDDWASFQDSAKQAVAHLESPRFVAKLRVLPTGDAARVLAAIDTIKTASAFRRRGIAMILAKVSAKAGRSGDVYAELRRSYGAVLAATGLSIDDLPVHSSALRELTLRSPASRLRLLYGVDLRSDVALVVLGEPLDRSFYGDSVRRAERVWQQFLESNAETRDEARSR